MGGLSAYPHEFSCLLAKFASRDTGVTLWTKKNGDVFTESGEAPVEDHVKLSCLQLFVHLLWMPDHQPQQVL